jgi:hypothetical protein
MDPKQAHELIDLTLNLVKQETELMSTRAAQVTASVDLDTGNASITWQLLSDPEGRITITVHAPQETT